MNILRTAIACGDWDLAAHALVLAAVKTASEENDAQKNEREASKPGSEQASEKELAPVCC